ncbi:hypothetical protein CASFOL_008148 [Castilleja foliolosa]|uniref:Uncharacterized protein n=1 Tax=Castilleja foliolosa TaxID=1961234 RepID=A0ABD3DY48_9LAMI
MFIIRYLIIFVFLVLVSAQGNNNVTLKDIKAGAARPPPVYRCVALLGVCGKTLTEARCVELCYDYYGGLHPWPHCDIYPGIADVLCFCEHDCMKG